MPTRTLCRFTRVAASLLLVITAAPPVLAAEPGVLFDASTGSQVFAIKASNETVGVTERAAGIGEIIEVTIPPTEKGYPGVSLKPADGQPWDLSAFGEVTARVINTGEKPIRLAMRIDDNEKTQGSPWNSEAARINPGQAGQVKIIFGYSYGFKPSHDLDASHITQILVFVGKTADPVSFQIESIVAGGQPGMTPPVDPRDVRIVPADGVILGKGVDTRQTTTVDGSKLSVTPSSEGLTVAIPAGSASPSINMTPPQGRWNLNQSNAVEVALTNTGSAAVAPSLMLKSDGGQTQTATLDNPIEPGDTQTLRLMFKGDTPWQGAAEITKKHNPGTPSTTFRSDVARQLVVSFDTAEVDRGLRIDAVTAVVVPDEAPDWLGKRPPVEGDWSVTLNEEFDSGAIDESLWNIYSANYWDTRTHFSRDNLILEDGVVKLRYEKKTGYANDDPEQTLPKTGKNESDYACGILTSYGKWVQKYGYFEARMKLPKASGLWPAFWMMPDRGEAAGPQWVRANTKEGGMEFDIMEHLTGWGPYRYNIALHWDGYGETHKATGTSNIYVGPDEDGYITSGMLWLPGQVVFYCNGIEVGRWDNDRVSNVASYPILYMVSGGWDNSALDDKQLPADFVVDYLRIWQRADLVSDANEPQ